MSLLGVDVGTTGCKAIAFDMEGQTLAYAYREYPLLHPQNGWSELDTDAIWQNVSEVIQEVNSQARNDPVKALSVSCQGEAVTAVDRTGKALFNFSVSFDHRTIPQYQWWRDNAGSQKLFRITGLPLHAMYTINKIMWYKQNTPDLYKRAVKFLCVEDFINYRLTGRYATDRSLAARTMAFDIHTKQWSQELLNLAGIDINLLPAPYPSGAPIGEIPAKLANELGLSLDEVASANLKKLLSRKERGVIVGSGDMR